MLTPEEFGDIKAVLVEVLARNGGSPYFQAVFASPEFMVKLSEGAGPAASHEQVSGAAIQVCMRREWLDTPCWLLILLGAVKRDMGQGGVGTVLNIDKIIDRIVRRINILNEIWYTHWVEFEIPFFDRSQLRQTLVDFSSVGGRGILRIEGDPKTEKTGRSYTHELIEYVSDKRGRSFRVIRVKLEDGSEIGIDALLLSQLIVGEMGKPNAVSDSPLPDPTVHNIPLLLCWILRCARDSNTQWWLLLDGFWRLPEKNSARDLIQGLADKIGNESHRQHLRMVLIDYDKPLSRVDDAKVAYDRPDRLPDSDALKALKECLRVVYADCDRMPTDSELETRSLAVLTNIPATQPWIVAINQRVRATAKGIRNGM
jgi:hypothetical protein